MKRGLRSFLTLVCLTFSLAFAQQDMQLVRLAERLLAPWPDPSGATTDLLAGELPDDLPLVLPLPESTDLIGSQVWRSASGELQNVQVVADVPLSTEAVWSALVSAFEGKGWEVRPDQLPTGFVPQENSLSGLFCAPVGGVHMYANVNYREVEPTDLRLNLNLASPDNPCAYGPMPMYGGEGFAPLPTLLAPKGVEVTVHASPVYNNQASSTAILLTDKNQQELMDHYEAQLTEAGWAEEETEEGLSRWRYTDENGIEWEGVLGVTTLPGGAYFATLGVVVTSRG